MATYIMNGKPYKIVASSKFKLGEVTMNAIVYAPEGKEDDKGSWNIVEEQQFYTLFTVKDEKV